MKTILFVSTSHNMGGAEYSLLTVLRRIDTSRFRPIVACPSNETLLKETARIGVKTEVLDIRTFIPISTYLKGRKVLNPRALFVNLGIISRIVRNLRRAAKKHNADLIQANDLLADIVAGFAAKRARLPVLWYLRDNISEGMRRRMFDRLAARYCTKIIAVSERTRSILSKSRNKSLLIYNGVDLEAFHPGIEYGSAAGYVMGIVGRISEAKGFETFLYMAERICRKRDDVVFHIVGGPKDQAQQKYYDSLKKLSKELSIQDRVVFMGERSDMPAVYGGMDILVLPSQREALPRTLIEAQACNTALLASNVGGVPEIIEEGENGFIVEDWLDSETFAAKALQILDTPDLRKKMGAKGRIKAESEFDISKVVEKLESLYIKAAVL